MRSLIQLIFGLLFITFGIFILTSASWLNAFLKLIQGGIVAGIFSFGLLLLFLAVLELKA